MKLTAALVLLAALAWVGISASSTKADAACPTGSALAFATIRPQPNNVAGQIRGAWTSRPRFFWRRFNCTGRRPQVRHLTTGLYDLRFPGLRIRTAVGSATTGQSVAVAVEPLGNDIVRVSLFQKNVPRDVAFTVIVY